MRSFISILFLSFLQISFVFALPGDLDSSFGSNGTLMVTSTGGKNNSFSFVIQPDGKLVVASYSYTSFEIYRFNSDGTLDTSFGSTGIVSTDFAGDAGAVAVTLQSDGKILAAGWSDTDFAVARYNSNGSLDTSFSGDGKLTLDIHGSGDEAKAIMVQADGKIVVAGRAYNRDAGGTMTAYFALTRLSSSGVVDTTYGASGIRLTQMGDAGFDVVADAAMQSDGKVVVVGRTYSGGQYHFALARYDTSGTLDTGFSGDGKVLSPGSGAVQDIYAIAVQTDGKLLTSGHIGYNTSRMVRYNTDGSLDVSFDGDGIRDISVAASAFQAFQSVVQQTDGKILAAGLANNNFSLVRVNSDGSTDSSFGSSGVVTTDFDGNYDLAYDMALDADGKIVLVGTARLSGESTSHLSLARYIAVDPGKILSATVTGAGSLDSLPVGINCPGSCSGTFAAGTTVTLNAHPSIEWTDSVMVWTEACLNQPTTALSCDVLMDADKMAAVAFYCDRIDIDPPLVPITNVEPAWNCRNLEAIRGFVIGINGDVTFEAENSISLGSGFVVGDQGIFRARIVSP